MKSKIPFGSLFTTNDADRAVSPVIGVILMVAITVILASTAGAFLFGFGSSSEEDVQAGVTVSGQNSNTTTVTWTSEGSATGITFSENAAFEAGSAEEITTVGNSVELNTSGKGTVSVIAENEDTGASTVIRTISYDNE